MRRVLVYKETNNKYFEAYEGWFHQWVYPENLVYALVERSNGNIDMVKLNLIKFLDTPTINVVEERSERHY